MTDAPKPRPLWKNPWLIAFVFGVIFLTVIRPRLRHVPEPPPILGPLPAWSLVDQDNETFGSEDLEGHVYLVSFFFTHCVTICPTLQKAMKQLEGRLADHGLPIKLVSITVDPENDTPDVMKAYGEALDADFDRWTFVTGEEKTVRDLIVGGFRSYVGEKEEVEDRPGVFDMGHGGRIILMDPEGNVRGHYEVLHRSDDARVWTIDEQGVSEVFHRARRVQEVFGNRSSTPFGCGVAEALRK